MRRMGRPLFRPEPALPTERPECANCAKCANYVLMTLVGVFFRGGRTLTVWRCGECLREVPVEV